jgi:hypothetical protein
MNSTPLKPEVIMWSTALPPQPPTPITLITASWVSTSISSNMLLSSFCPKQNHTQKSFGVSAAMCFTSGTTAKFRFDDARSTERRGVRNFL